MAATSFDRPPEPADPVGIPSMLLVMCMTVFAATVLIMLFVAEASWWLLGLCMVAVLAGGALVLLAISRALDDRDA